MQQTATIKIGMVIIGVNPLTNKVIEIIELENKYEIIGLIDCNENDALYQFKSKYQIYHDISEIKLLNIANPINLGVLCIEDSRLRKVILKKIVETDKNFQFINAIHPTAIIGKNTSLGKGNIIGVKAIINPDSKIKDFCLIKDMVSIGHDTSIGDFVTLNTNATLGGNVIIGRCSILGMSSKILQNISVAKHCIIKDNALVLKDTKEGDTLYGVPAKVDTPE